jgi:transposase
MVRRKVFASQGQEAFLEGHLHAFDVLGGVPTVRIRYHNLRSAVWRVLFGHRDRGTRKVAAQTTGRAALTRRPCHSSATTPAP